MLLIAFSVLRTSVVKPRYLCAALKVTRENLARITSELLISQFLIGSKRINTLNDMAGRFRKIFRESAKSFRRYNS